MKNGKCRKKSHRNQGESEGRGVTNSRILTYIADTWEDDEGPDDDDIELYLKKQFNIIEKTGVKAHISYLLEKGYIVSAPDKNGKTYYKLKEGFEYFRKVFNCVYKGGCCTEFMQTKYYNRKLSSPGFQIKLIIHVLRNTILYIVQYAKPKKTYFELDREARRIVKKSSHPELLKNILGVIEDLHATNQNGKLSRSPHNEWSAAFIETVTLCRTYNVDQIAHILIKMDERREIDLDSFEYLFTPLTEVEWETLINILKSSPSAMDAILNQREYDPIRLTASMIAYYVKAILLERKKREIIAGLDKNEGTMTREEVINAARSIVDFSNIVSEAPIIVAMRNAFERDRVNGKLAKNEYTTKLMASLSKPKLKEDE